MARSLFESRWSWFNVARLCLGLGAVAGGMESVAIAQNIALKLTFVEALVLMVTSVVAGALLGFGTGLALGLVMHLAGIPRKPSKRLAAGLGLCALGIAAFYFLPLGMLLLRMERPLGAAAAAALPLGVAGMVYYNARYWLRRAEIGAASRFGWQALSLVLAVPLAVGAAGWAAKRPRGTGVIALEGDANVLLVTLDTLRRDHLSAYTSSAPPTPRFDAFAEEGLLFLDAVTPLPETGPAHASLFTSLHPVRHGVISNGHTLSSAHTTLAERLGAEGYDTAAFVSSFAVDSRTGLDQGFHVYDDDFFPAVHGLSEIRLARLALRVVMRFGDPLQFPFLLERSAAITNDRAIRWLASQRNPERPFFCWVHYFEPHAPYEPHPGSPGNAEQTPDVDHRWILAHEQDFTYTEEVEADLRALYREEAIYTDHQLGRLLDAVRTLGLADDTLVIVTADHGEMLGEHDFHFNHHSIYEEAVRVPLAVRVPGFEPKTRRIQPQVRLMDVPSTVLAFLELDEMEPGEGVNLLNFARGYRKRSISATLMGRETGALDKGTLFGLRTGRAEADRGNAIKYIRDMTDGEEELYDLVADPREQVDLSDAQPEALNQVRTLVEKEAAFVDEGGEGVDAATREALKALGYVE